MEVMSIHTQEGERVKYSFPNNGYDSDIEFTNRYLTVGKSYTVASMDVDYYRSRVYLKEFPGIGFNTVMFSNVKGK